MKPETKYKGSIKLSAIGDALGWMTEFEKSTQSLYEKFGTERIESFHTWTKQVEEDFTVSLIQLKQVLILTIHNYF